MKATFVGRSRDISVGERHDSRAGGLASWVGEGVSSLGAEGTPPWRRNKAARSS